MDTGSLYPARHGMEEVEWIASAWRLSHAKRQARYYALTAAGRTRLTAKEEQWFEEGQCCDAGAQVRVRCLSSPALARRA
ncbi:MAG: hypothetical protein PVSMB1_07540 [Gemmatimonadaceae bacterium]